MDPTLETIDRLSGDKATLQLRLGEAIGAILDLGRICETVRYEAGLSKQQWERVEKARAIAAEADAALSETRLADARRTDALLAEFESRETKKETA